MMEKNDAVIRNGYWILIASNGYLIVRLGYEANDDVKHWWDASEDDGKCAEDFKNKLENAREYNLFKIKIVQKFCFIVLAFML